jgi:hypothetical protein
MLYLTSLKGCYRTFILFTGPRRQPDYTRGSAYGRGGGYQLSRGSDQPRHPGFPRRDPLLAAIKRKYYLTCKLRFVHNKQESTSNWLFQPLRLFFAFTGLILSEVSPNYLSQAMFAVLFSPVKKHKPARNMRAAGIRDKF